jgi:hypothetical protein
MSDLDDLRIPWIPIWTYAGRTYVSMYRREDGTYELVLNHSIRILAGIPFLFKGRVAELCDNQRPNRVHIKLMDKDKSYYFEGYYMRAEYIQTLF